MMFNAATACYCALFFQGVVTYGPIGYDQGRLRHFNIECHFKTTSRTLVAVP